MSRHRLTWHLRGEPTVNRPADAIVPSRSGKTSWLVIHHAGEQLTLFLDAAMIDQLVDAAATLAAERSDDE